MITGKVAVMNRPANDHLTARIPRSVVRVEGSGDPVRVAVPANFCPPAIIAVPVILIVVVFSFRGVVPKKHDLNVQEYLNSYLFYCMPVSGRWL